MGDDDPVSSDFGDLPEPKTDDIDRAPGGADATTLESDVGAGESSEDLVTPDQPLSAQQEEEKVPDAIQEPEEPESDEQATDNTKGEEAPSG